MRNLRSWADQEGIKGKIDEAFLLRSEVRKLFLQDVEEQNGKLGAGYLKVKAFCVLAKELALEAGDRRTAIGHLERAQAKAQGRGDQPLYKKAAAVLSLVR